ncbi:MAG TPA: methyltransferase domain-containing protein [Thermoanaerobaculia bacterium]|nr:methyltransferase domain-containing protein [Thermoanaerobaculia bacterium]
MPAGGDQPRIEEFLGEPTRDPVRWRWLWEGDHAFPIRSDRPFLGRLLVAFRRLLRPFVRLPQNDLWERQRVFNLILLEWLAARDGERLAERLGILEGALPERTAEILRHNDALYARLDQKLDRYRHGTTELSAVLSGALAAVESQPAAARLAPLVRAQEEASYLELERRYRGTEEEIAERLAVYLPRLAGRGTVLDLGCGRGESLALFGRHGIPARGVDLSASMVARCRERGLDAEVGDAFGTLAVAEPESLGGVVSFHVIEHLPADEVDRLVRLAARALAPGGVLILETPNPLSVVVAARNFWLDPTHRRPIHPESLILSCRLAGLEPVERLDLRPFPATERLPEISLEELPESSRLLAHRVNEIRDRLDDLLFGFQDYAVVAEKPGRG